MCDLLHKWWLLCWYSLTKFVLLIGSQVISTAWLVPLFFLRSNFLHSTNKSFFSDPFLVLQRLMQCVCLRSRQACNGRDSKTNSICGPRVHNSTCHSLRPAGVVIKKHFLCCSTVRVWVQLFGFNVKLYRERAQLTLQHSASLTWRTYTHWHSTLSLQLKFHWTVCWT